MGEIDAGDKIIYLSETIEQKSDEEDGISRLLAMLPNNMGKEYLVLWKEFEAGVTPESKYAKAIDRVPPLLQNIHDNGHGWQKHSIPKEMVFALNSIRIAAGSDKLWEAMEMKLNEAVKDGFLN